MTHSSEQQCALLLSCQDTADVAFLLTQFFSEHSVPLTSFSLYRDSGLYLARASWQETQLWPQQEQFIDAFEPVAKRLGVRFSVRYLHQVPTVGLICSTHTHVLQETLSAMSVPHFPPFKVPFVISDDEAARRVADRFGVPFFPIGQSEGANLQQLQLDIIRRYRPDFLGLARYDALLGQRVIDQANCPIVTVHNSLLPSVKSEKAYAVAYDQGVKMVSATSRLVESNALGPIIEQDALKVGPGSDLAAIRASGHQIERKVFVRSLRKLVEHKVMVYNAKAIVFD